MIVYHPCYIDSVSIIAQITKTAGGSDFTWQWYSKAGFYKNANKQDALYKTTFELDPAKQAYQALYWDKNKASGVDSSRVRSNTGTDYQTVTLEKEFIEFPKSDEKYPVAMYTPMASYLHKNVGTDKTKLDMNKPNMVTVAFGINMSTTRCFNWVSAGEFNEYVWVRKQGETSWKRFESYTQRSLSNLTTTVTGDDGKTSQIVIGKEDSTYNTYRSKINNNSLQTPYRKEFTWVVNNTVYARINNKFPGTGVKYTAHKCILEFDAATSSPVIYEYVVGRGDKNNAPDAEHTSEIMTFTLYPSTYEPRLYQTTDQQGFHWIEYQTWGACAKKIDEIINDQMSDNIIPVVLNTGDATQNGTRVNEWLDYYIGGKCLFNHLEQMSIVGNNDLCDNDPSKLGTGDDWGKSNGYYHHIFYCYEVDEKLNDNTYVSKLQTHTNEEDQANDKTFDQLYDAKLFKYLPIVKGNDNVYRYIPSLYFFGTNKYTFVMMNSELTYINCGEWFNKKKEGYTVNLYTGWTIPSDVNDTTYYYDDSFTTIYKMLYNIITDHIDNKKTHEPTYNSSTQKISNVKNLIVACHEMPFTVVTAKNLLNTAKGSDRSLNNANGNLVGSHMNRINKLDVKSNYWFSRLLEYFNVKLVYGGHKHTYAITNELRENYLYTENGEVKSSIFNGKMTMPQTLEGNNDTAVFEIKVKNQVTTREKTVIVNPGTEDEHEETRTEDFNSLVYDSEGDVTLASSKYPIMNINDDSKNVEKLPGVMPEGNVLFPYYGVTLNDGQELGGVKYVMCQATGFKLKSNKELPGPNQRFSYIIPFTDVGDSSDTPSDQQLVPMFTEIRPDTYDIYLMRLVNIHKTHPNDGTPAVLSQKDFSKDPIRVEYLYKDLSQYNANNIGDAIYGIWTTATTTDWDEQRHKLISW